MDDLERQLNRYAGQLDRLEPVSAEEVFDRALPRHSGSRRALLVATLLLVVVVIGGAVVALAVGGSDSDEGPVAPVETTLPNVPPAPLRARLELPSDTLASGSGMEGVVVVDNATGGPIDLVDCGLYAVALANADYHQGFVKSACAAPTRVPVGESRWPVAVTAYARGCGELPVPPASGECPQPLPPGLWEVRAQGPDGFPTPEPVTIEIVEPGSTPERLQARLELPSDQMVAGSTIEGEVVVNNDTGAPIKFGGCGSFYQAGLARDGYRQEVGWLTCLQQLELPIGESRWLVGVMARERGCTTDPAANDSSYPRCLPSGAMPAVPAGQYEVFVAGVASVLPIPESAFIEIVEP
jgi:hypothetical protein